MEAKDVLNSMKTSPASVMSSLWELQVLGHIAHLQANSYAVHMALGTLYEELPDLIDRFVENSQGSGPVIKGYSVSVNDSKDINKTLQECRAKVSSLRASVTDSSLAQILDDVIELISTTVYKLERLK